MATNQNFPSPDEFDRRLRDAVATADWGKARDQEDADAMRIAMQGETPEHHNKLVRLFAKLKPGVNHTSL